MMKKNDIIALGIYEQYRQLCHGVKDGNSTAIQEAATMLASIIPNNATLVPIPSHHGYATYMLDLALQVARVNSCSVDNCIVSSERAKLYDMKMKGLSFYLDFRLLHRPCGNLYLIDNCVDTKRTYNAACNIVGQVPIITIGVVN